MVTCVEDSGRDNIVPNRGQEKKVVMLREKKKKKKKKREREKGDPYLTCLVHPRCNDRSKCFSFLFVFFSAKKICDGEKMNATPYFICTFVVKRGTTRAKEEEICNFAKREREKDPL